MDITVSPSYVRLPRRTLENGLEESGTLSQRLPAVTHPATGAGLRYKKRSSIPVPENQSLPHTTMSSAQNNNDSNTGRDGAQRNKGKGRATSADERRWREDDAERQKRQLKAELLAKMSVLQRQLEELEDVEPEAEGGDGDADGAGEAEGGEDADAGGEAGESEQPEERPTGTTKRPAPEEESGGEPAKKRRKRKVGPEVPNQWEADRE